MMDAYLKSAIHVGDMVESRWVATGPNAEADVRRMISLLSQVPDSEIETTTIGHTDLILAHSPRPTS